MRLDHQWFLRLAIGAATVNAPMWVTVALLTDNSAKGDNARTMYIAWILVAVVAIGFLMLDNNRRGKE